MREVIIGWFAALIAAVGFGSFAVPIKGEAANSVDIDPLVMQSYKSLMCFLTSWLVLLIGQEFSFTWWGMISGLFWVPAGVFNVFAFRNAGLAVSCGIISSSIVMISFLWGHLVFKEKVKSELVSYFAVSFIMIGLYGMSYYSSTDDDSKLIRHTTSDDCIKEEESNLVYKKSESSNSSFHNEPTMNPSTTAKTTFTSAPIEMEQEKEPKKKSRALSIYGKTFSRKYIGLCSALMGGIWGGSCLVPMHYSTEKVQGLGYVISFSIGALTVTIGLWALRFAYHGIRMKSICEAYDALPSFHLRVMWAAGALSGCLWSFGNVGSIVAVQHLGQGVGYSASQAALLISGMWGIFWFKEVTKPNMIRRWFLSASVTIGGILLLGYESHADATMR